MATTVSVKLARPARWGISILGRGLCKSATGASAAWFPHAFCACSSFTSPRLVIFFRPRTRAPGDACAKRTTKLETLLTPQDGLVVVARFIQNLFEGQPKVHPKKPNSLIPDDCNDPYDPPLPIPSSSTPSQLFTPTSPTKVELVCVMLVGPFVLNAVQFVVSDQFLKLRSRNQHTLLAVDDLSDGESMDLFQRGSGVGVADFDFGETSPSAFALALAWESGCTHAAEGIK